MTRSYLGFPPSVTLQMTLKWPHNKNWPAFELGGFQSFQSLTIITCGRVSGPRSNKIKTFNKYLMPDVRKLKFVKNLWMWYFNILHKHNYHKAVSISDQWMIYSHGWSAHMDVIIWLLRSKGQDGRIRTIFWHVLRLFWTFGP